MDATNHVQWSYAHWVGFCIIILFLLFFDLLVAHKKNHAPSFRESTLWTMFWCSLAGIFNFVLYQMAGKEKALEFTAGYLIEWSLSMDNVFVFAVVFRAFRIPIANQYRVLFWGIFGAIVMRFFFVITGAQLIYRFHWVMWVFGFFLIYTGIRLCFQKEDDLDPEQGWVVRWAKKFIPIASNGDKEHFFVKVDGKWFATPLFIVLLVVESTDLLFAIDSVPAVFGVSKDPFIVFTSNIFAILGLRALYFMLAGFMDIFKYLHYGLSVILIFVGVKMNLEYWYPLDKGHWFSPGQSLAVIVGILFMTVLVSVISAKWERKAK